MPLKLHKRIYPSMQIARMRNPGVVERANQLAEKQRNGWLTSKSIHPNRQRIKRVHVVEAA